MHSDWESLMETDALLVQEQHDGRQALISWEDSTPVEDFQTAITMLRDMGYKSVKFSYFDLTWNREVMGVEK